MKYEKRNCKECGEEFIPKGKNQFGVQKFCSDKCRRKFHKKKENQKKKLGTGNKKVGTPLKKLGTANNRKTSLKEEVSNIHQPLYQVKKGFNLIKKLDKIHEDLVNYMNILKLDTYPEEIKNHCIYIMKESNRFLQNQLKLERDKGVIIVQKE